MNASEKVNFISNWIKDYVNDMPSKAQSLVIGISGGIDSSVSSTLSAMTGLKTIVLSMPIKQKSQQHDLSLKHQEWLVNKFKNVEAHTINLDELFLAFSSSLSKFDNEHGMANSRARLRMTTLYQVAAANKGIVVGTGNKVEDFGVGFYTKYGDGGVDISPIADCNKTEVWEIGKELFSDFPNFCFITICYWRYIHTTIPIFCIKSNSKILYFITCTNDNTFVCCCYLIKSSHS